MANRMRKFTGFTLVELVVVIVLLGITAAVIVPRFMQPNAFSPAAAQDGLIATIRAAQQAALGRSNVTFRIEDDVGAGRWIFTARHGVGNTIIRTFEISKSGVTLETGSSAITGGTTCAASGAPDFNTNFNNPVTSNFVLTFDAKGDLASFTNGGAPENVGVMNGVRICVSDTVAQSVCVSPAGYAYAGNCDA